MPTAILEGTGASITFSVSAFTAALISLTLPEESVEAIDTTHLGTVAAKTSKPGKLKKVGSISCEFEHDPTQPALLRVEQDFTINWPLEPGQATPYMRTYSGYVSQEGGEEFKVDSRMTRKVTIEVSGDWEETAATLTP